MENKKIFLDCVNHIYSKNSIFQYLSFSSLFEILKNNYSVEDCTTGKTIYLNTEKIGRVMLKKIDLEKRKNLKFKFHKKGICVFFEREKLKATKTFLYSKNIKFMDIIKNSKLTNKDKIDFLKFHYPQEYKSLLNLKQGGFIDN